MHASSAMSERLFSGFLILPKTMDFGWLLSALRNSSSGGWNKIEFHFIGIQIQNSPKLRAEYLALSLKSMSHLSHRAYFSSMVQSSGFASFGRK